MPRGRNVFGDMADDEVVHGGRGHGAIVAGMRAKLKRAISCKTFYMEL
jgi:hypothetical protein